MQDFRRLTVWAKAHQLTLRVYAATRSFPREELFGLTSQMRRAASSVTMNLAERTRRR
ncbi:MAG TPA: four helix bundle protein [Gemmataceae bacterium]|nr:four helix bundle protein [Gemmataceae bacterium]